MSEVFGKGIKKEVAPKKEGKGANKFIHLKSSESVSRDRSANYRNETDNLSEEKNFLPKSVSIVRNAFDQVSLKNKTEDLKKSELITVLDLFAFPEELLRDKETFLVWFEERFFTLRKKEDFDRFSRSCFNALKVLEKYPFLLSPRIGKGFSVPEKIKERITKREGFSSVEDIMGIFQKIALKNVEENIKNFFTSDRKSVIGSERLAWCRILSLAYALEVMKQSHELREQLKYARFVLGLENLDSQESGLLATLNLRRDPTVLEDPEMGAHFLEWLERGEKFFNCRLHNLGESRSFSIPEVHIGTKSGLRCFLKVLRDPRFEFQKLDDFFRLRFIFEDKTPTKEILEILKQLQLEAEKKKDIITKIDFRVKNYFSQEEIKSFLAEEDLFFKKMANLDLKKKERKEKKKTEEENSYFSQQDALKEEESVSMDAENSHSHKDYKNISAKAHLFKPGAKDPFFSFEIQFMRRGEFENNENLEGEANHFIYINSQFLEFLSRFHSKMGREEIINGLVAYLSSLPLDIFPKKLKGTDKNSGEKFIQHFGGSIKERAELLFDFFLRVGVLGRTTEKFPQKDRVSWDQKKEDCFFVHREILIKVLNSLEYSVGD